MYNWIKAHQLNIMLALCAVCATMMILLLVTRFLTKRRKWILILMELTASCLIGFDRAAYLYRGDESSTAFYMVRISNFMVFFITSATVLVFNLYLIDLLDDEAKPRSLPKRLKIVNAGAVVGMGLVIVSQFTGLYYYFDGQNNYHRGPGFLICYIIPVLLPIIQFTVIRQYKKFFSRLIYISLVLYIFVPIIVGIIQIFAYGLSIVNMSMVLVSIFLYIFNYLDVNDAVERTHEIEVGNLQRERGSMKRVFDQTVTAFVTAVEKKDPFSEGHPVRVAETARKIASAAGMNEEECEKVYYSALLHDVGMMGIPDTVIQKADGLTDEEVRLKKQQPVLSGEILSSITEYPYLSQNARYCCERYDGKGYPDGLKGEEIPEVSRIIAVADAYDSMIDGERNGKHRSYQSVREEFIKESGLRFDPEFSDIMVQIMDSERKDQNKQSEPDIASELDCIGYRNAFTAGIPVKRDIVKIRFTCEKAGTGEFSAPSVIVFASYDKLLHNEVKTVEAYHYVEYGELWFDGREVSTNARKTEVTITENKSDAIASGEYEITAGRYEDHLSIRMVSSSHTVDVVMAIPDVSRESYISLSGENCALRNITVTQTGERTEPDSIRKIVSKISYIDRLESDLPNVQVEHARSAYTESVEVKDGLDIEFHTMSLPSANLVWHCPCIILFYSEDKKVGGKGYKEYALIKLNGEVSSDERYAQNDLFMRKTNRFPGWDKWKSMNKEGMECSVHFAKKGSRVVISTENLGIAIENTTVIIDGNKTVYAVLTGNRVALTDIRLMYRD